MDGCFIVPQRGNFSDPTALQQEINTNYRLKNRTLRIENSNEKQPEEKKGKKRKKKYAALTAPKVVVQMVSRGEVS